MYRIKTVFCLCLLFAVQLSVCGQGIRGTVRDINGKTLPNASIFIRESRISSTSNEDGQYFIKLPAGRVTISISYLGYNSQQLTIEIRNDWVEKDFILTEQYILLNEVTVGSDKEDYAYTIIRKAIAKKKFHLLQYDSFQMTAYIKGSAELKDVPSYLKKKFKEKGLDEAYTLESVSQFNFRQPDKIDQRVISIRTKGEENPKVNPSQFLNGSFYKDKINGSVSPLSTSAFMYYKFKYEGSFVDNNQIVYKIKVTPRSKGDNVFDGFIYLIDEYWAIHSLDLTTRYSGIPVKVKQQYAEVARDVWLPITHKVNVLFKVLGYLVEYNYLISCSNYKVEVNKDLIAKKEIIDESVEKIMGDAFSVNTTDKKELAELLASETPVTRKEYVKLIEKYEKVKLKELQKSKRVINETSFSIDSLAGSRDSTYWDSVRTVPLTAQEQRGYHRLDSIAKVQLTKKNDSITANVNQKFTPFRLIRGGSFSLSEHTNFTLQPVLNTINFNTVEGLNINLAGKLLHKPDTARFVEFTPVVRYGFSSERFYGKGKFALENQKENRSSIFYVEGGSFVEQFNKEDGIKEKVNSINTLVWRKNFMNIYEKQYLQAGYGYSPSAFLNFSGSLEWSQRSQLHNRTDYSFFFRSSRNFTPNVPQNSEISDTNFPTHQALTLTANISYRPIQRYTINNGKRVPHLEISPEIKISYVKGISNVFNSDVDFDKLLLSVHHSIPIGAGDKLDLEFSGGSFLNNRQAFFMDYQHFNTNLSPLDGLKSAGTYRLLDYYFYSTSKSWVSGFGQYKFRKLLFTQIPEVRLSGLKENVFMNYLKTTTSPHYCELGYSLDNIFRILRIEIAASFTNGAYKEFDIRYGVRKIINKPKK